MIIKEAKQVIKYIIELDINFIETFQGYKGDTVLKVKSDSKEEINKCALFLENMGLSPDIKHTIDDRFGDYTLYVGFVHEEVYQLK